MDVIGLGTEIVECVRIRQLIDRHAEQFLCRIFTEGEIRACNDCRNSTEQFAGRWCAKSAVLKALGGIGRGQSAWGEIEIEHSVRGGYGVRLTGSMREFASALRVAEVKLSIALTRMYALATAIALGDQRDTSTTN